MIDITSFAHVDSFFAAANGFDGFRSIFGCIFNPRNFTKIFILKGGPGTGKSTILKGIISYGCDLGCSCSAVYCSSDPASLDGAILEKNGRRLAFLDGTAPHTTDPMFPGAVEEIVNLGESFETDALEAQREAIILLGETKSKAYRDAYKLLNIAGTIWSYLNQELITSEIYSLAEEISSKICKEIKRTSCCIKTDKKFYGSFSKNGYTRLPIIRSKDSVINIKGDPLIVNLLMSKIYGYTTQNGICITLSPSPLSEQIIDRIYTPDYIICANENMDAEIDVSDIKPDNSTGYDDLCGVYDHLLKCSAGSFKKASDTHFEIEGIYTKAMNFENNDNIFNTLKQRVLHYLSI